MLASLPDTAPASTRDIAHQRAGLLYRDDERCKNQPMPISLVIAGAGSRGNAYAEWARRNPERATVVAVAEPDVERRRIFVERYGTMAEYDSWQALLAEPKLADACLICTQDADHVEPTIAALDLGYDVLLEKPVAPTLPDIERVCHAARDSGRIFAVCHVLRFTPYTQALKQLLADDAIGDIISVQHLEPVGWYHMAHSFVRGNWRNEAESSFMLLAKSCHDIDWLSYVVDKPIRKVSSFGRLSYFTPANRPVEAADRCLDCLLERSCAYSATRLYLDRAREDRFGWPVEIITKDFSVAGVERALREGPYGRCVFACDNDVVDHQVVAMEFEGGATGTFQMLAFTDLGHRRTTICGTQGELSTDGETIDVLDFRTGERTQYDVATFGDGSADGGHGGGDGGIMDAFCRAVETQDQSQISTTWAQTLASHRAVFTMEQSRREGRTLTIPA